MNTAANAKVMIVEDDAELVRGLKRLLESDGYEVVPATVSLHALPLALREQPDLIVLDVMMPGIDGWEVLRRIRASASIASTPVMMLTAKSSVDDRVFGLSAGADDYLTKPFALREFRARIDALLRRSRSGLEAPGIKRMPVTAERGVAFVDTSDIMYIEGMRNHCMIHTSEGEMPSRMSLGEVEMRAGAGLMRVHRSYIVNLDAVRGCHWATKSAFVLSLKDGSEVPVSRTLVAEVRGRLGLC
jgi:DNA-binding response OmpR family regulator